MNHISVRQATKDDIEAYIELQKSRWSQENTATREELTSRLKSYPQGMLVAEMGSEIVGMVYAMRISTYDYSNPPSWYEITNNGMCTNADPKGEYIFGVDLSTKPGVGGAAGDRLLLCIGQIAVREGIKAALLGGRMPGYHKYAASMSADEYLKAKDENGKPIDRQIRYYTSVPGLKAVKAIPEYFHDPESLDYGVLLEWKNPFAKFPAKKLFSELFALIWKIEDTYKSVFKRRQ